MKNKRDFTDYVLWVMIYKIFMKNYDWKTFLLCMLGAAALGICDIVFDEFF